MKIKQTAFTLIELMVTIAIIGLLASIAYPSYQSHIKRSKEAEARAALISFAGTMGQFFLEKNTYKGAAGTKILPADTGSPWIFSTKVPIDGGSTTYNLTISSATSNSFLLKATPVDSSLDTYTLNELGVKTPSCDVATKVGWC